MGRPPQDPSTSVSVSPLTRSVWVLFWMGLYSEQIISVWLEPIPGRSASSPIVFGNPTFVLLSSLVLLSWGFNSDTSLTEPVRGYQSIFLPYLLYFLPSTHTPPCAYVHPLLPLYQYQDQRPLSPIVDDLGVLKSSTIDSHLRSHLSHIGQASDTWGHVHATLQHPLHHVDS
jgi:hypothetical protein